MTPNTTIIVICDTLTLFVTSSNVSIFGSWLPPTQSGGDAQSGGQTQEQAGMLKGLPTYLTAQRVVSGTFRDIDRDPEDPYRPSRSVFYPE